MLYAVSFVCQVHRLRFSEARLPDNMPLMQAFYGVMDPNRCTRFVFMQASEKYQERPNPAPQARALFRQVSQCNLALKLLQKQSSVVSAGLPTNSPSNPQIERWWGVVLLVLSESFHILCAGLS